MPSLGIEPGPHWWETSALTTAPSLVSQTHHLPHGSPMLNQLSQPRPSAELAKTTLASKEREWSICFFKFSLNSERLDTWKLKPITFQGRVTFCKRWPYSTYISTDLTIRGSCEVLFFYPCKPCER